MNLTGTVNTSLSHIRVRYLFSCKIHSLPRKVSLPNHCNFHVSVNIKIKAESRLKSCVDQFVFSAFLQLRVKQSFKSIQFTLRYFQVCFKASKLLMQTFPFYQCKNYSLQRIHSKSSFQRTKLRSYLLLPSLALFYTSSC